LKKDVWVGRETVVADGEVDAVPGAERAAISDVADVATVPAVVLGGSGYVAGELLRLLAGHPVLRAAAVLSESQAGQPVEAAFPHLAGSFPGLTFAGRPDLPGFFDGRERAAVFSAAPHGASAALVDEVLSAAEQAGTAVRLVDLSADFRYPDAFSYEDVYAHPHGAPSRLPQFFSALPEHFSGIPTGPAGPTGNIRHIGHPGCFTTAVTLATVPLLALGLIEPCLHVVATTGSTGAGRTPTATTHHPARRSTMFAYNPLAHRHAPEMRSLALAASGVAAEIHFVPQAGPYARGIYATLQARLAPSHRGMSGADAAEAVASFYDGAPFVTAGAELPRLQDVVGTNRCRLGITTGDGILVACSAIDNLVKGAAGGAVQWMNRLLGLPETAGLTQPGLGWL
jgi:N-acetyl-gamma-glutamyl-phosphate reductase common form